MACALEEVLGYGVRSQLAGLVGDLADDHRRQHDAHHL
jgi:hypothetical protein